MKYCSHVKTSFRGVGATDFESFSLNTVKLPASQQHAQQVYLQHSILCMLKCISLPIYKVAFMATWKGGGQDTASGDAKKSDTVRSDSLLRQNQTSNYSTTTVLVYTSSLSINFANTGSRTIFRFRYESGVGWSNTTFHGLLPIHKLGKTSSKKTNSCEYSTFLITNINRSYGIIKLQCYE